MPHIPRVHRLLTCAAVLSLLVGVAGCSRENEDWRSAQAADTSAAYERFLHQYPRSPRVKEANLRLAQLAEDEAWHGATTLDTQLAYQQFLARYPDGRWAAEARVRVENFSLAPPSGGRAAAPASPAPAAAAREEAVPPPPPAEEPAPKPQPKPRPRAVPAAVSGFGVQLGAFTSRAKADAAWERLAERYTDQLGRRPAHQLVPGDAGGATVYRLRVPQASESAARDLCRRLKARGQDCLVYKP